MRFKDYYEVLGVKPDASADEIKSVYRKLARKFHPDVSKEKNAEERFKDINEAFEALKDTSSAARTQIDAGVPPLLDKAGGVLDALQDGSNNVRQLTADLRGPLRAISEDGRQASGDARLLLDGP